MTAAPDVRRNAAVGTAAPVGSAVTAGAVASAGADVTLDLDAAAPPRAPRRRPSLLLGVAAAVAALVGASTASAGKVDLPPALPSTVATMTLDGVVLDPAPTAVLVLSLHNAGTTTQIAQEVRVEGGGTRGKTAPIGQEIAPGATVTARIGVPLGCPDRLPALERVSATVHVRPAHRGAGDTVDLAVVGVGRAAQLGGLCSAADAALPEGWRLAATASTWQFVDGDLELTVTGLPADAARLMWVEADGVLVPQSRLDPAIRDRTARIRVPAPAPGCRDSGVRAVVPTGLQLHVETPGGLRAVYVPIGAEFSQWLMDAFVRSCPSRPDGPPAVRPVIG